MGSSPISCTESLLLRRSRDPREHRRQNAPDLPLGKRAHLPRPLRLQSIPDHPFHCASNGRRDGRGAETFGEAAVILTSDDQLAGKLLAAEKTLGTNDHLHATTPPTP